MVVGVIFFLGLSVTIAVAGFVLLTSPSHRRASFGAWTMKKSRAALLAAAGGVSLFAAIFVTSLSGFHTVRTYEDEFRVDYAVPSRAVVLPYGQVVAVEPTPAWRLQWRLVIRLRDGRTLESATGSRAAVEVAAAAINGRRAR